MIKLFIVTYAAGHFITLVPVSGAFEREPAAGIAEFGPDPIEQCELLAAMMQRMQPNHLITYRCEWREVPRTHHVRT